MNGLGHALAAVFLVLLGAAPLAAQLRLSSLSELQYGRLPGDDAFEPALYGQLTLDYAAGGWRLSARGEGFDSGAASGGYAHLLQRAVEYRRGGLELGAGHFYDIAGSGLLLHAFELPGVVTEDRGTRRRYQIIRDLDGVRLAYRRGPVSLRLWRGTPVNSGLPPGLDGVDRRQGTVQGGTVEVQPLDAVDLGGGALRLEAGGESEWLAHSFARLRLGAWLAAAGLDGVYAETYAEYAQRQARVGRWLSLYRDLGRSLYASLSLTVGDLGLSFEFKDYRDFQLAQINDPPTLIREHDAFLLNRVTHDILADDEAGTQTEVSYALPGGRMLTANYTTVRRRQGPGAADDLESWELFVQAQTPVGPRMDGLVFADFNRTRILADERRITVGSQWNAYVAQTWALSADVQYQDVDRRFGAAEFPFENYYLGLEVSPSAAWSCGLTLQRSTDALETGATAGEAIYWWGGNAAWDFGAGHSAYVFAGKRRFGLACTGGTCYEVLGFEGVELRLVSRFL